MGVHYCGIYRVYPEAILVNGQEKDPLFALVLTGLQREAGLEIIRAVAQSDAGCEPINRSEPAAAQESNGDVRIRARAELSAAMDEITQGKKTPKDYAFWGEAQTPAYTRALALFRDRFLKGDLTLAQGNVYTYGLTRKAVEAFFLLENPQSALHFKNLKFCPESKPKRGGPMERLAGFLKGNKIPLPLPYPI